ncbi:MAG: site-specific DNA-methyltransferase [Erysipelotrichia bacterium]|nr:site-specific DNA-methyltransferase [Erysipelotrichia bacterium]
MHTADLSDEKFLALQDLFPEAVTETITTDENGERVVTRAIDADVLQQLINKKVVSGKEERYQFTWPDKKKAMLLANAPINKTLRPCREESVDFDNTENLYIEGDNLDVLKLLRETYLGKIKMIYIDPPYNTGNDFVYKDDFAEDTQEFLRRDNQIDEQGNRLVTNTESNGRFHTNWLNMMYPRLKLARDLLTEDGVIFISIDDNEIENLKKVCNEIFGEINFATNFVWEKGKEGGNDSSLFRSHYENILCFCKNSSSSNIFNLDPKDTSRHKVNLPEENLVSGIINEINQGELFQLINLSKQKDYLVKIPLVNGDEIEWPSYAPQSTVNEWIRNGKLFVGKGKTPYVKSFLKDELGGQKPSNIITQNFGSTKSGSIEIRTFFGSREIFSYPKPSTLIHRLIQISSKPDSLILDFFSGSSTTAHAVMQLNAKDNGSRKFIMVQLPEETDEKSEAFKAGFRNICEIGKERIRKAGIKIKDDVGLITQNLDIGFRVLKLDDSNMNNVFYSPDEYKETNFKFEDLIENVKEDRTQEDILFQVMLELGVPLSAKINIDGSIITVDDDYLVACFDKVDSETVTRIAKMKPYYAVFRDSSFINDSSLINVEQIFNTYSPTTKRRVI